MPQSHPRAVFRQVLVAGTAIINGKKYLKNNNLSIPFKPEYQFVSRLGSRAAQTKAALAASSRDFIKYMIINTFLGIPFICLAG
jgi:hypothetical protein